MHQHRDKTDSAPQCELMLQLLPETYGVMVYQEDVLKVAHRIGGMSLGEADLLRRAMSGKMRSRDAMIQIEEKFFSGARSNGLAEEQIQEIWRQISSFAGYSFCKGHSAAFAVLSYQVAYLKAHHPAEFFAAVLSNEGGFYGAGAYIEEARRMGIEVFLPCINLSELNYEGWTEERADRSVMRSFEDSGRLPFHDPTVAPPGSWLRIGLGAISGLSTRLCERIVAERERNGCYKTLSDFVTRTGIGHEDCRTLIKAGALDCFLQEPRPERSGEGGQSGRCGRGGRSGQGGQSPPRPQSPLRPPRPQSPPTALPPHPGRRRTVLLLETDFLFRQQGLGQNSLSLDLDVAPPQFLGEFTFGEICKFEAQILGYIVSAHPLDFVQMPPGVIPARDIRRHARRRIRMAGWVISIKIIATKTDGKPMKMITMEDKTDTFETVLFPRVYEKFAVRALTRGPYLVSGKVDVTLGSPTLNIEDIRLLPTMSIR